MISSFGAIAGVLLSGLLCRFASQANVLRVACVLGFAASLLLPHATTATQADLFGAIWGLQCGVLMVVTNSVWAEYYGGKSQGAIEGFTMFVQFAAQAGGPWLLTSIAGNSVAPGVFFYLLAALFVLLFLSSLFFREYDQAGPETSLGNKDLASIDSRMAFN